MLIQEVIHSKLKMDFLLNRPQQNYSGLAAPEYRAKPFEPNFSNGKQPVNFMEYYIWNWSNYYGTTSWGIIYDQLLNIVNELNDLGSTTSIGAFIDNINNQSTVTTILTKILVEGLVNVPPVTMTSPITFNNAVKFIRSFLNYCVTSLQSITTMMTERQTAYNTGYTLAFTTNPNIITSITNSESSIATNNNTHISATSVHGAASTATASTIALFYDANGCLCANGASGTECITYSQLEAMFPLE